jgi:hypothetical protein
VIEKRVDPDRRPGTAGSEPPLTGLDDLAERLQMWREQNPGRGDPNAEHHIHRHMFISVDPSTFPTPKHRFSASSLPDTKKNHHYAGPPPLRSSLRVSVCHVDES